jgi:hypothetical protein
MKMLDTHARGVSSVAVADAFLVCSTGRSYPAAFWLSFDWLKVSVYAAYAKPSDQAISCDAKFAATFGLVLRALCCKNSCSALSVTVHTVQSVLQTFPCNTSCNRFLCSFVPWTMHTQASLPPLLVGIKPAKRTLSPSTLCTWGQDSSVGIATGYGLDGSGIESQ